MRIPALLDDSFRMILRVFDNEAVFNVDNPVGVFGYIAFHDASPETSAMWSQSEPCGAMAIIAFRLVEPPTPLPRGYHTPFTCPDASFCSFSSRAAMRFSIRTFAARSAMAKNSWK